MTQNANTSWFVDGGPDEDGGTLRPDDDRLPVMAVTQMDKDAVLVAYEDKVKVRNGAGKGRNGTLVGVGGGLKYHRSGLVLPWCLRCSVVLRCPVAFIHVMPCLVWIRLFCHLSFSSPPSYPFLDAQSHPIPQPFCCLYCTMLISPPCFIRSLAACSVWCHPVRTSLLCVVVFCHQQVPPFIRC